MKYIQHKQLGFVLFENGIAHRDMAQWLSNPLHGENDIISAGFVSQDELNPIYCHGQSKSLSKSLSKRAHQGDTENLRHRLEQR